MGLDAPETDDTNACPVCGSQPTDTFFEDKQRPYLRCGSCQLVFVPPSHWLSREEEKATYDLHRNDVDDPGYRRFLARLGDPLLRRLASNQKGLDFGCGPGPALAQMLRDGGHRVDLYDPFYYDDAAVFTRRYDFICATEVVEHLRDPRGVFNSLFQMLRPNGWLGIMTKLVIDREAFRSWHYIRDPTHICFFSRKTFAHLSQRYGADLFFEDQDVVLLQKVRLTA